VVKITQRENAYRHIRLKIASGESRAGERLYPAILAREIGVSLIPVREAIGQLQSEQLVVHKPHRGFFVKELERRDLMDLVEFRGDLECIAAARAARRISPAQLRELDRRWQDLCRVNRQMCQVIAEGDLSAPETLKSLSELTQESLLADLAFHTLLFRAAGNRRAFRAMEDAEVMLPLFSQRTDTPGEWADKGLVVRKIAEKVLEMHKAVYEAIHRRDPKAARRAMRSHMRFTAKRRLARFDWLQRQEHISEVALDIPESMSGMIAGVQRDEERKMERESDQWGAEDN
jgi:DNA-binding GntR family transcriptional regulator